METEIFSSASVKCHRGSKFTHENLILVPPLEIFIHFSNFTVFKCKVFITLFKKFAYNQTYSAKYILL